jgi:hypothetical protein
MVLAEVTEFTALARAGAYMGGDRRVTPTERTRWRLTFQRLAGQGCAALRAPEPDRAAEALTLLIDLANDMCDSDYFHSGDPVEAAGFVLSDAAALLWDFTRDRHGFAAFADLAAPQLIRWESCYGWTRSGYGKTSKKETSLAQVLASMLRTPGTWTGFAQHYLAALDQLGIAAGRSAYAGEYARTASRNGTRCWPTAWPAARRKRSWTDADLPADVVGRGPLMPVPATGYVLGALPPARSNRQRPHAGAARATSLTCLPQTRGTNWGCRGREASAVFCSREAVPARPLVPGSRLLPWDLWPRAGAGGSGRPSSSNQSMEAQTYVHRN